jgi:bifunctional ADP-heptose synthase (sugar kinase/adenylyltransferase)|tara:strand:- start:61 stop:849 length:789 start_codon:yes stop_codon:yes gene_type:complete
MKVLVIGDSCQDVFVYGDIERISPEAPVPVFVPTNTEKNDGMARNVSHNVESLEMFITTITNKNGIVKRRYVDNRSGQMVLRVDEHDYCERIDKKVLKGLRDNKCTPHFGSETNIDAIIISDYCKGFLEEEDIQFICDNNDNVFVDTKKKLGRWIESADFIKINELEYKKNHELLSDKGFEEKLIVTLGSKGCRWNGRDFSVEEVPVKDVSGAGDTFLAGLVRGYLDTNNIEEAIRFAQKCTTIVVQKHGVATVTLKELQNG